MGAYIRASGTSALFLSRRNGHVWYALITFLYVDILGTDIRRCPSLSTYWIDFSQIPLGETLHCHIRLNHFKMIPVEPYIPWPNLPAFATQ